MATSMIYIGECFMLSVIESLKILGLTFEQVTNAIPGNS